MAMHLCCGQMEDSCGLKMTLSRVYPHAKHGSLGDHKPEIWNCGKVLFKVKVESMATKGLPRPESLR
jgi:hypothetical protein